MIIVLIGPMGCGKTTIGILLADTLGWRFEDGDDFHPPANVAKMNSGIALTDADRVPWLAILRDRMGGALAEKTNLVLACSALKKSYRQLLGIDQKTIFSVYLKGSAALLQHRLATRKHRYMKNELLQSQLDTLEEPEHGLTVAITGDPDRIVASIIEQLPCAEANRRTI